jgi:O-antigen/teichoic acid export membrane protein
MTPVRNVVRLSAAFLGSNLARAGIGFALSFILARGLGADGFGRWILCTAWASTLTVVLDLGFGVLLTRDGARDQAEADRLLISALLVRLAAGVPLAALLFAGAGYISHDAETIAALRVASLLGTAGAAYGCFGALFRSQPRWLATVLAIETGWLALQCGGAWWLVMAGQGAAGSAGGAGWAGRSARADIVSLMVLALAVQLAQIVTAVVCWRLVFAERQQRQFPQIPTLWALLRRALPFAASGIVANLQTRVGPLMLGYLSTSPELGLYAAASRFGSVARLAPQAMFAGALPVLTQEHQRDRASAERVFRTFDMMLLGATVAVAAGSALFAAPVLRLVYGPSFAAAAPALFAVSVGLIPMLSNSGRKVFLYASGGETRVVRWSAVSLIVQVCVGAALIPVSGGVGAAASLAVGEAIIWWPLRRSTSTPAPRTVVTVASELSPTSPVS